MDIKVEIDKEQVQQQIVSAILDSAIGDEIEAAIKKATSSDTYGRTSVIQQGVDVAIQKLTRELILSEYGDKIKEIIRTKITDDVLDQSCQSLISKVFD